MVANFPTTDGNQKISAESKAILDIRRPVSWLLHPLDGDDDYGLDFNVQFSIDGQVRHTFRAQLKGTASPSITADGASLSISLKRTTLNLYAGIVEPVLLIVCVLQWAPNGRADLTNSKVYFRWMHEALRDLRGSRFATDETAQQAFTIRVPLINELTPETDIGPDLIREVRRARAAETLEDLAQSTAGEVAPKQSYPLEVLTGSLARHPTVITQILRTQEAAEWINPAPGSVEQKLMEAAGLVRNSRTQLAQEALDRIDASLLVTPPLKAEHLCLQGKVLMQRQQTHAALVKFEEAHAVNPREKYLLALVETKFLIHREDVELPDRLMVLAKDLEDISSDEALSLRSRILLLAGAHEQAVALIARLPEEKRLIPQLLVLTVTRDSDQVLERGMTALEAGPFSPEDDAIIQMLLARACWGKACTNIGIQGQDNEVPLAGPRGLDSHMARQAWIFARRGLERFQQLSWPINVLLIADVAVASACSVGEGLTALALLRDAGAERREYLALQEHLELLAMHCHDFATAIQANSRQPENTRVLVRRATQHFNVARYQECLHAALAVLERLDADYRHTPMALACGFAAARRATRPSSAARFEATLNSNAEWAEYRYFAKVLAVVAKDEAKTDDAKSLLREGLTLCPDSRLLAANLFMNTAINRATEAAEAVALARRLRREALLDRAELFHLIAALLTLQDWARAEEESRAAIERFGQEERFISMLAVCMEMQGKTSEAFNLLDGLVSSAQARSQALRTFLGITLRLGKLDKARACLDRLLAEYPMGEDRLEWMRLRVLLAIQLQEGADEILGLLDEVSVTVNRDDEDEEAMYLSLYVGTTLNLALPEQLSPRSDLIAERMDRFSERWPLSSQFRKMSTVSASGAVDIHRVLDALVGGDSKERLLQFEERERQLKSGQLPIPFIARPGFALHYVGECFSLWEIAKSSKPGDRQFHLLSYVDGEPAFPPVRVLRDTPLLDLISLLVLKDLKLLDTLLRLYPRIAIPRATIGFISQHSHGPLVSRMAAAHASSLLHFINQNLARIDQPGLTSLANSRLSGASVLEDFVQIARTGSWVVFSDDACTRAWVRVGMDAGQPIAQTNTVQMLDLAEHKGILEPFQVSERLGLLCAWNVGILVEGRYLIAALPQHLPANCVSVRQRLELFQAHVPFSIIARAVWNFEKSAQALIQHMGSLLVLMLSMPQSQDESAAGVWAFWYFRVKQHPEWNGMGMDLLGYTFLAAVIGLPQGAYERLARSYAAVIELDIGERMNIADEIHAIGRVGYLVAHIAARHPQQGDVLRSKVGQAFVAGTMKGDAFTNAFYAASVKLSIENGKAPNQESRKQHARNQES